MAKKQKKLAAASPPGRGWVMRWAVPVAGVVASSAAALFFVRSYPDPHELERVPCAARSLPVVPRCTPRKDGCGREVVDDFASAAEVEELRALAERGMALGGGAGGPTILDLQSGALSLGDKFIDVHAALNHTGRSPYLQEEVAVYKRIVARIAARIASTFEAEPHRLFLTAPTFFSRISSDKRAVTEHDEYWHSHVDTLQYGSFEYTSLLYLTDHGQDFEGGQLHFESAHGRPSKLVSPRRGRLAIFTSGEEFPHNVQRVTKGTRLALTIAFTCQRQAAIEDFLGRAQ